MKISSQDLLSFSLPRSILNQIKTNPYGNSQMGSGSHLKGTTPILKDTVSLSTPGTGAKSISMEIITKKRLCYFEESDMINAAVVENIGGGYRKAYDALKDLGIAFLDEMGQAEWKDLAKAAVNAGENVDVLLDAAAEYGRQGKSIDALSEFLSFAADLSTEELADFLSALKDDPGQAEQMIGIAEKLGSGLTGLYLKTAGLNQGDLEDLNAELVRMMEKDGEDDDLASYFRLAVNAQDRGLDLLEAFGEMTTSTRDLVSTFGTTRLEDQNIENFITLVSFAEETAITEILNRFKTLKGEDLQNMVKTASNVQGRMPGFLSALDRFSQTESFSQFLITAANAEHVLPALLDNLKKVDVNFSATLSTVDTVNYLEALDNVGDNANRLNRVREALEGRDRSLFFYAAAHIQGDAKNFLDRVNTLDGKEQSDFFLQAANRENPESVDQEIYLKGILSDDAFKDYQATRANLQDWQADSFIRTIENMESQSRGNFLKASAAAKETASSFLTMFDRLGFQDQNTLLEINRDLGTKERAQFVKAAVKSGEDVLSFMALTRKIMEEDDTGQVVSDFLDAAEKAGPAQLKDLTDFLGSLNKGGRKGFLSAVTQTHYSLSQLLETGKKIQAGSHQIYGVFDSIAKGLISLEQAMTYYG